MPTYRADINPVEVAEISRKRKRRTIALVVLALLSALVALAYFQMPSYVGDAFLAIEDERFYEHAGIDNKAILRALFENTRAGFISTASLWDRVSLASKPPRRNISGSLRVI